MNNVACAGGTGGGGGGGRLVYRLREGEMLVADNRAVAHGRLEYGAGEPRRLWRVNYDGDDGQLGKRLKFGCMPWSS